MSNNLTGSIILKRRNAGSESYRNNYIEPAVTSLMQDLNSTSLRFAVTKCDVMFVVARGRSPFPC